MPRVAIGGISHETNTFSPIATTLESFRRRSLLRGAALIERSRGVGTALGGIVDAAGARGWELAPTIFASAVPSGIVERRTFEVLAAELIEGIRAALPLDGVVLALHGAMVVDGFPDGEGEILARLRRATGPDLPIVVVLDFHANLTPSIAGLADLVIGYDTYPHVDPYDRGVEAVDLLGRVLSGEIQPARALRQVPLLTPLPAVRTDGPGPMREIMEAALELEGEPGVLAIMLAAGFPYSDVNDAGMAVLVNTDSDPELAVRVAGDLADTCWGARERFTVRLVPPADAVRRVMEATSTPVVLADIADNPGAGGSCDGTTILRALLDARASGVAVAVIADPESVDRAFEIGEGGRGRFALGGKVDHMHGPTLDVVARVRLAGNVVFTNTGPMGAGGRTTLGRTAVLDIGDGDGIEVIVTANRVQVLDPELFRAAGIPPEQRRGLVVKSSVHFRVGFKTVAREIIEVDAPGLASPDLGRFSYRNVRRPIWPLDPYATFE